MNGEDLIIESMTQTPEQIAEVLKAEGYEFTVETHTDQPEKQEETPPPATEEGTSSSAPPPAAGENEGAGEEGAGKTGAEAGADSETAEAQERRKSKPGSARLKERIHEKDAEIGTLKARLEELERKLADPSAGKGAEPAGTETPPPAEEPAEDAEPAEDDFDTYADFTKAYTKWAIREEQRQEKQREREAREQKVAGEKTKADSEAKAAAEAEQKQAKERWDSKLEEAREKHPDFDAVALNPQVKITPVMAAVAQDYDEGAELAYRLGQHPEEAARIAELTVLPENPTPGQIRKAFRDAYREFDRILSKLSSPEASRGTPAPPAAPPPKSQPAPPLKPKPTPPTPVGSRGSGRNELDPDEIANLSNEDFRKRFGTV